MDYINPTAGLPENNFPNNPFWSGVKDAERGQIMQPFLDNARQQQNLTLQKQQLENGEFASPEAVRARMSGFTKTADTNTFDAAKARADLDRLPQEEKLRISDLANKINSSQGEPHRKALEGLASIADVIERTPEPMRQAAYAQHLQNFFKSHPGTEQQLPDQLKTYSPESLKFAKDLQYSFVMDTPTRQAIAREQPKIDSNEAIAATRANTDLEEARIRAAATRDAADTRAKGKDGKPLTEGAHRVQLRKALANPNISADDREIAEEEMKGYLSKDIKDEAATRSMEILQGKLKYEDIVNSVYERNGIKQRGGKPTQKYEVGKIYEGKTGTFKYLGGDPKDAKSFQKVN